ncbi:hypothetical protein H4R33_001271 [Dimargaris cristalligena]|uniref:Acyl-protein thioesterase 1 n=1 Tax=Dimargaris cristalligena TaxID=215637 RepID=A0A4P9ZWP9_9FUNG|nr:hypothetical protein H4R33_001271 [Dimargaris cristalligena]RKP37391.1 Phospholipase/carboxylesterase/thioesterase [Dimargaris cristalligena]|eukprot:RKP37391.1 Phospholipase/carboxylesterase/thioesterase [Dimargaris cristalligena]
MAAPLTSVVQKALKKHTATVIFIHGLGDSGSGWAPVARELSQHLPHVKFVLPNAPVQPVTLNNGFKMPSWYDIYTLGDINRREDQEGMLRSVASINKLISEEVDQDIPSERIVVAGFSQGAAMTLLTGLTSERKLAGMAALSGYLPLRSLIFSMASDVSRSLPIFMAHGQEDEVVSYHFGQQSAEALKQKKYNVDFHTYPNMGHSSCLEEVQELTRFLARVLPEN